jgi:hypothetical protein
MEEIFSHEQIEECINPHYGRILEAMNRAFQDYMDLSTNSPQFINTPLAKRTIAGLVHDFTKRRIVDAFQDIENVTTGTFNSIFGLVINGKVFIRFKKIKPGFSTANIQTKQTKEYNQQVIEFPDFPGKTIFLYAGYQLNSTWTGINNFYMFCREGECITWIKDLSSIAEQTSLNLVTMPTPIITEVVGRVRVKGSKGLAANDK